MRRGSRLKPKFAYDGLLERSNGAVKVLDPESSALSDVTGDCVRPRPLKGGSPSFCKGIPVDQGECDSSDVPGGRAEALRIAEGGAVRFVDIEWRVSYDDRELHVVVDVMPESCDVRLNDVDARVKGPFNVCKSGKPDELWREMVGFSVMMVQ